FNPPHTAAIYTLSLHDALPILFTDEDVAGFDSNYKVSPPLRTKTDAKALIKALKDGIIDAVVSQHTPQEVEFKNVEFHIAKNGRSEEHTSELQSRENLVCRLLL